VKIITFSLKKTQFWDIFAETEKPWVRKCLPSFSYCDGGTS